jgi:GNAT superfamily N-acetyltransferase
LPGTWLGVTKEPKLLGQPHEEGLPLLSMRVGSQSLVVKSHCGKRPTGRYGNGSRSFFPIEGNAMTLTYQIEPMLAVTEFIDVLVRSTLAERRPVHEPDIIRRMLEHADLVVTARHSGLLVGVSRALTDYAFCTYLSDLAVDEAYQRRGIGRELIRRTHEAAGLHTVLILLAAPKAQAYYPHIGMTQHLSCWMLPRQSLDKFGASVQTR